MTNVKIAYKIWNGYSSDENDLVSKIAKALNDKDAVIAEKYAEIKTLQDRIEHLSLKCKEECDIRRRREEQHVKTIKELEGKSSPTVDGIPWYDFLSRVQKELENKEKLVQELQARKTRSN